MTIGILKRSLVLSLFIAGAAIACDDNDDNGLDVALVLSGGGALATTHVGAIRVIEQLGVPVHCVVGTSMGSVVGALYAAGYDAAALEEVFLDSRWPEVFNSVVSRREKSYLLKEQDDLYLSGYLAGINRQGLRLPGGFRSMSGLRRLFRSLLPDQPVTASFDDLHRPFRAVAMDLSNGAPVALDEGDLVESMLASMAVPGVFPPRQINGRVLVDGGLAAQLPVDIAQAMGADLIIALDTTVEPPTATEDWSVAQVSQQLIRLTVWQNWQAQRARLGSNDVLIQPDISRLSTSSFDRAKRGFASGAKAASRYEEALLKIRSLAAPAPAASEPQPARPAPQTLIVANETVIDDDLLRKRLGYRPEDLQDTQRLQRKLRDLVAFGPFGETDLALSGDGQALLQVEPFPLGRNLLSGGIRAANTFRGDSRYALLGQLSRRPFAARGGDLRLSAELGTDLGLGVELYLPFGEESRFFSVSSLGYRAEQLLLDQDDRRIGEYWQQRGEGRLRLGRELGDWGVLAMDGIVEAVRTETLISVEDVPAVATDLFLGGGVLFAVDTLDRANWPERGLQLSARAERLEGFDGGSVNGRADSYSFRLLKPLALGPLDLLLRLDAAATENKGGTVVNIQRLGGFRRLSARAENSLLNDRYLLGSLEVFRRLNPSESVFSIPLYIGALFEAADAQLELFEPQFEDQFYSLATYVGTDTALGPFFLGTGFDFDGNFSLFMHFGRTF